MLIPFANEPTPEERYKKQLLSRIRKAKHLSDRMENLLIETNKAKIKEKDKRMIKDTVLKFLERTDIKM